MRPIIRLGKYALEESIDNTIQVVFSNQTGGFVDEIDVSDEIRGFIWVKISKEGKIRYIEIVNPKAFWGTSFFDGLVVNGYNIKELLEGEIKKDLTPIR